MPGSDEVVRSVFQTRVRYAETDRFGIAHHSSFVPWFECGRVELLRQLGHDYDELERRGFAFPLVELGFRYDAPARLDETIRVEAVFLGLARLRVTFGCRILDADGRPLARAFSVHAFVDREMKVLEITPDLVALISPRLAPEGYLGRRFGPGRSR